MILKLHHPTGSKFKHTTHNSLKELDDDHPLYIDISKNIKEISKFESLNSSIFFTKLQFMIE